MLTKDQSYLFIRLCDENRKYDTRATPVALPFPRFSHSHFRFGRKGTERKMERTRQRDGRGERVNPESHGNLATSAIGRTCTRSNLKARSRTGEQERRKKRERKDRAILSFVRAQCASYVRTLVPFIDRALFFICRSSSPPRVRSGRAPWDTSGSTFIVTRDRRPFVFVSDVRTGHLRISHHSTRITD